MKKFLAILFVFVITLALAACTEEPTVDPVTPCTQHTDLNGDLKCDSCEEALTDINIAYARNAEEGAEITVDGVVARITYSFGMKPAGFVLVDESSSIYVYGADAAASVSIGNKVTVKGIKAYWVLESEQSNADKYGYKGACQLDSPEIINVDTTPHVFEKSWISESTVKEIIDTPASENITSKIFKVTALVKKAPGSGFTNYYFYDLDGTTGSYTYTQCNGSDFGWLDEFDGKICTVYLTALNAKSSPSGTFWRFLPISVVDEGFTFDKNNSAEHAVKYYGVDQFLPEYGADPSLELVTSVSSELLGFENATLSYSSSDTSVVYFETADGKTVMHCKNDGNAIITVTGSYGGVEYSETLKITVKAVNVSEYMTPEEAFDAELGTEVTVKGIVGPSLVNQDGFYLMGESGMIAVRTSTDVLASVNLGDEVILKGVRYMKKKNADSTYGNACINDAVLIANNYGNHEYNDSWFVTDKTVKDFYDLPLSTDYTATVFVLEGKVVSAGTAYYTSYKFEGSDETQIQLYCSSAAQYSWLEDYVGQNITVEIAACNWNSKSYYAACILAIRTEDGKIYNTLNFDVN